MSPQLISLFISLSMVWKSDNRVRLYFIQWLNKTMYKNVLQINFERTDTQRLHEITLRCHVVARTVVQS